MSAENKCLENIYHEDIIAGALYFAASHFINMPSIISLKKILVICTLL